MPPIMMKTLVTSMEPQSQQQSTIGQIGSESSGESKMIKSATGSHISPVPSSCYQQTGTADAAMQNSNFPRGSRNRQTFHGKTEHTKGGSVGADEANDSEIEEANALTIGSGQTAVATSGGAQRGSFLSKLTKLTKRSNHKYN
jgi:hypothetical protein